MITKLFGRVCKTCKRIFYCDNDCGKITEGKYDSGCECGLCHTKTTKEKGHSCEERLEQNKYRYPEVVQFT